MEKTADVLSVVWDNLSTDYEQRVNTLSKSDDKVRDDLHDISCTAKRPAYTVSK